MKNEELTTSEIITEIKKIYEEGKTITDDYELFKQASLRQREVLALKLRFVDGLTYDSMAKLIPRADGPGIGIGREAAHQITKRALRKLRHPARHSFVFSSKKLNKEIWGE